MRALLLLSLLPLARAVRFELANVFTDGLVLQRDQPTRIWGWAPPALTVFVALTGPTGAHLSNATARAGDGLWVAALPALPAGGAYSLSAASSPVVSPAGAGFWIALSNVFVGEVILCSGQSNVQINMDAFLNGGGHPGPDVFNFSAEIQAANAHSASLRFFLATAASAAAAPLDALMAPTLSWAPASNLTAGVFSALCYFAGVELTRRAPGVVVGLIDAAWGNTRINAWSPPEATAACPPPPNLNVSTCDVPCRDGALFNSMIAPLAVGPLAVRAIVWGQGESDRYYDPPTYYACALAQLMDTWRARLSVPGAPLPFWLTAQLSAWDGGQCLAAFRAMQAAVTATRARADSAILFDLGDAGSDEGNVHSRRKREQGARVGAALARGALGAAGVQTLGPTYARAAAGPPAGADGRATATVAFARASLGAAGRLAPAPGAGRGAPTNNATICPFTAPAEVPVCDWFALRVDGGAWLNATAAVVAGGGDAGGDALALAAEGAPAGARVTATRYGWAAWPVVAFTNADGLPVVPWAENITAA